MRLNSKLTAIAILTSFVGIQLIAVPSAIAQDYKLVPPTAEQTKGIVDQGVLPTIDANQILGYDSPLKGQVTSVPSGTLFDAKLNTTIGSAINEVGDTFTATLITPITANGVEVVPSGSQAVGQITYLDNAGKLGKDGVIEVQFTNIQLPNGMKVPIRAKINTVDKQGKLHGKSIKKQIAKSTATVAVGTGGGALAGLSLGAIVSSIGPATVVGAATGGIVTLGYIVANKGRESMVPADTNLTIILEDPLNIGR